MSSNISKDDAKQAISTLFNFTKEQSKHGVELLKDKLHQKKEDNAELRAIFDESDDEEETPMSLEDIEQALSTDDEKVDFVDMNFEQLIDFILTRMAKLTKKTRQHEKEIDEMNKKLDWAKGKIDKLEKRVEKLEENK